MLKTKAISAILVLTMAVVTLSGCGSSKQDPTTTTPTNTNQTSNSGKLTDGVYKVEYDKYDTHGYKPQLELTVSGGKITEVKFDEVTQDGKLKSTDASYKEKMQEGSSTYPEKAYNELKQQLLSKQSTSIDSIAGATVSSTAFKTLVTYAINEMAKKGITTPAKITAK